ncbi:T9SS type A sorting domain-containing protein [Flavobacterium sp. FlaQc-50]|uniref:T9SS type A sorting domain-containing protein n=1 Tax=unclassified Flavobacterium TaxID=196869 RepID=UPI0037570251
MRSVITIVLLATFALANAQQKVTFGYDTAGNQISRVLCLSGCTAKSANQTKEIDAIVDGDLQKFFPEDVISYYPNPVKEELYLKWELIDNNKVSSVVVYGLNGQTLETFSRTETINTLTISFQQYLTGIYLVVLNYTDGDQKTVKIIKQKD